MKDHLTRARYFFCRKVFTLSFSSVFRSQKTRLVRRMGVCTLNTKDFYLSSLYR